MMLGAATAFANEAADERHNRLAFQGATARAAVQADYLAARANGTLPDTGETASLRAQTPMGPAGTVSRDDARREARVAARTRVIHESIQ